VSRAKEVRPDFTLTSGNTQAVAEICRRLDGLPLAIELAAARVRLLAPEALLSRLDRALPVLTGGARNLPERQQTLRNTIAWSYDLLVPEEQRIFRCLSVFAGSCSLEAASALCAAEGEANTDVLDGLESLVDKSLLQLNAENAPGVETRLRMLETVREFALERLSDSNEADRVRRRHAEYFLALAEEGAERLKGEDQIAWLQRLSLEHDDIRAALAWALDASLETALRMVGALWRFWWLSNHWNEGREWLAKALTSAERTYSPERMAQAPALAKAYNGAGVLAIWQGDDREAYDLFERGLQLSREAKTNTTPAWRCGAWAS
jgi:predicted ATPase